MKVAEKQLTAGIWRTIQYNIFGLGIEGTIMGSTIAHLSTRSFLCALKVHKIEIFLASILKFVLFLY
jgi:hypothetical protein